MSDSADGGSVAKTINTNPLVESVLSLQFPMRHFWEQIQQAHTAARTGTVVPELQQVKQRRSELQALSSDELQRMYAELKAAKLRQDAAREAAAEANRFYNQPQAQANFAFWLKADFWTFDDAIALLLGKNPNVVTWEAVDKAMNPKGFFKPAPVRSQFLTGYMALRDFALRSEVMTSGPKLRPVDVVTWATQRVGMALPEPLRAVASPETRQPLLASPTRPTPPRMSTPAETGIPKVVRYTTKARRRDSLAPVIEQAQDACADPFDVAAVWARLQVMAQDKVPPLFGSTEDGLQYLDQGETAILNRKALWKRLARAKGQT